MALPKLTDLLPASSPPPGIALASGDAFFVRRVPLAADLDVQDQVELALESLSPFSPAQMYWGSLVSADRSSALVYAAYRRRLSTEAWEQAVAVLPDFLALCGPREPRVSAELHRDSDRVTVVIRDGRGDLPAAVLTRVGCDDDVVLAEASARAGLISIPTCTKVVGTPAALRDDDGPIVMTLGDVPALSIAPESADAADVRDDDFLEIRRRAVRRDLWLWRGLQTAAALLILAAGLDLAAGVMAWRTKLINGKVAAQSTDVQRIETAQTLVTRIAELGERRLMPMEMLAAINPGRPESIIFQRAVTRGVHGLEIEARTGNAADVGAYENTLRALPQIAAVETRDIRARDGQTSFVLSLDFKSDAFKTEVESGGAL